MIPNYVNISATRERTTGEITPVSAEHSATKSNDEVQFAAGNAIDLVYDTRSWTVAGAKGTVWLKITLDKVYCLQEVIWFENSETPFLTWTCTENHCSNCAGASCSDFALTVSTEGSVSDLSPISDCRYGDTVKVQRVGSTSGFGLNEFAAFKKQG